MLDESREARKIRENAGEISIIKDKDELISKCSYYPDIWAHKKN